MQPFHLEAGIEIQTETGVDRLLGGAQRLRGTGPELSGQPGRGVVDVAVVPGSAFAGRAAAAGRESRSPVRYKATSPNPSVLSRRFLHAEHIMEYVAVQKDEM